VDLGIVMVGMQHVHIGQRGAYFMPLDRLEDSHNVKASSARMYTRFFGQTAVRLSSSTHRDMLLDALSGLLDAHPQLRQLDGYGLYTKTQTHNTFFEQNWLKNMFAEVGLDHWEILTFSMTNCASGLAAVHLGATLDKPFIVLSGEKAFHPAGNRLSVGLLGEAAVSVLFSPVGKRRLRGTHVSHLTRYHVNPEQMAESDRKRLQAEFETQLVAFLRRIIDEDRDFFETLPVVIPYNLNPPLIDRVLQAVGLHRNLAAGIDVGIGHMFCSDNYLMLGQNIPPDNASVFMFSAGHGVTFAALKFEPLH
jgi:3-oxoacyl-[acyl-carrier-protein] synthase III